MWFKESNGYFCKIENFVSGEIKEWSFRNPHPRPTTSGLGTVSLVLIWVRFPHYWIFVSQKPPVACGLPHKGPVMWSLMVLFVTFIILLNKQLICRSSETPGHSHFVTVLRLFSYHYNDVIMGPVASQIASDCLLNRLFRRRSQKPSKLSVTGLCAGNSPVTGEFPAQTACNEENVSIWWRHHDFKTTS